MNLGDVKGAVSKLDSTMFNVMRHDFIEDDLGCIHLDTKKVNLGNMEEAYEVIQTASNALASLHKLLNG